MPATSDLLDTPTMRQLDTGSLVTLKQRIERELMRRGDVEQTEWTDGGELLAVDSATGELAATPTPLAKRQLLREPDPGCTRCWGRGIKLTSDLTVTGFVTELCPCLWGGE